MLAAVVGGGVMFFKGLTPADVGDALHKSTAGVLPAAGGGTHYPAPGVAPAGYPAGQQGAASGVAAPPAEVIRVATFNIQVFGDAKANKARGPDGKSIVMAYLAATVQNFDLIAIQEIRTKDQYFLQKWLADYVNQGGRTFDYVLGPRLGRTSSKEQYAFLYDVRKVEVNPQLVYTVQDSREDLLHREPLVAMFRAKNVPADRAFTFMMINTHTDPDETDTELDALAQVYNAVRRHPIGEDDVILLGDLNTAVPSREPGAAVRGRELSRSDLRGLATIPGVYPVVRNRSTNTAGTMLHDNILFSTNSTTEFNGRSGVFDIGAVYGLPRELVKQLSDHLPVWAEFSVYEGTAPGRVATGATPQQR